MRGVVVLLAGGCYAATPSSGVPCDPATPNCPAGQACIAGETGFACLPEGTAPVIDAANPDTAPVLRACPSDPDLLLCLSFDMPSLATPAPNEGALPLSAPFVNVSRFALGSGGAGLFSSTSTMAFPGDTRLVGIVAFEATIRLDQAIAPLTRVGLIDVDASASGMSMFLFPGIATPHRIRCNVGAPDVFADVTLTLGAWTTIRCTCENNETVVYRDGVLLAKGPGCKPGSAETNGVQIGQNSRAGAMLPPNEPFIGGIDRVQLWTRIPPQ